MLGKNLVAYVTTQPQLAHFTFHHVEHAVLQGMWVPMEGLNVNELMEDGC